MHSSSPFETTGWEINCPHFLTRLIRVVESIDKCDFDELVDQLLRQLNVFYCGGSGWVLEKFLSLDIKVCKTRSLAGSFFIPTPTKLARFRYSLLNMENLSDNFYFIYCILAFSTLPQKTKSDYPTIVTNLIDLFSTDHLCQRSFETFQSLKQITV